VTPRPAPTSVPAPSALGPTNAPDDAQPGWKWCGKCMALGYTGFDAGPCPAGDTHDHAQSGAYSVFQDTSVGGQPGWRRCRPARSR